MPIIETELRPQLPPVIPPEPPPVPSDSLLLLINRLEQRIALIEARKPATIEPIYIGAKDEAGNITSPLKPLFPGDGFYLHIAKPSLSDARN